MSRKTVKLVVLALLIALVSATGLFASAYGKELPSRTEERVIWYGDHEPDAYLRVDLTMQVFEERFHEIRDALIDNQITKDALLEFKKQWEEQVAWGKNELLENEISEETALEWEAQQREKFLVWQEELVLVD